MSASKKIAVFPEPGAIGPVMNLIGIAQGLRELGHECSFILDPGLAGDVQASFDDLISISYLWGSPEWFQLRKEVMGIKGTKGIDPTHGPHMLPQSSMSSANTSKSSAPQTFRASNSHTTC